MWSEWRRDEIDQLRSEACLGLVEVSARLNRSRDSVRVKAHRLGLTLGNGNQPAWSGQHLMILKAFGRLGEALVMSLTGRSRSAVRTKAQNLGISLNRNPDMIDQIEESASMIEHEGGWPKQAAEAMAAACAYCGKPCGRSLECINAWMDANPKLYACYDVHDPLATQVNLAAYAFDAIGTLDDLARIDPGLRERFGEQEKLWLEATTQEEREEHAGGMIRAYLAIGERIIRNG